MRDVLAYQGIGCKRLVMLHPHVPDVPEHHSVQGPRKLDVVTLLELIADATEDGMTEADLARQIRRDLASGALYA